MSRSTKRQAEGEAAKGKEETLSQSGGGLTREEAEAVLLHIDGFRVTSSHIRAFMDGTAKLRALASRDEGEHGSGYEQPPAATGACGPSPDAVRGMMVALSEAELDALVWTSAVKEDPDVSVEAWESGRAKLEAALDQIKGSEPKPAGTGREPKAAGKSCRPHPSSLTPVPPRQTGDRREPINSSPTPGSVG